MIGLNGLKIMSILKLEILWRIVKKILKSVWWLMPLFFHFKTNYYSLFLIVLPWNNNLYSSSSSKEWFWTFSLVIYSIFIESSSIGCGTCHNLQVWPYVTQLKWRSLKYISFVFTVVYCFKMNTKKYYVIY